MKQAAVFAIFDYMEKHPELEDRIPIIISGTITDASGRTLSGQTTEAFYISMMHAGMTAIGLNCALGTKAMKPYVKAMSGIAECFVSVYPNAGLPDEMGMYRQTPEQMAEEIREFLQEGYCNLVGGCCGSSPDHIAAIAKIAAEYKPRKPKERCEMLRLSGLEPMIYDPNVIKFINVGERCNVAGSIRFKKMILDRKYENALAVARAQVENGAQVCV